MVGVKGRADEDASAVQAQIGVSISLARSLVASWLPPQSEAEKAAEAKAAPSRSGALVNRRAPRAGLGSTGERDAAADLSVEEMKIKRRLLHKEKKLREKAREREMAGKKAKRRHSALEDGSSSEEEVRKGEKKAARPGVAKASQSVIAITGSKADRPRGFGRP